MKKTWNAEEKLQYERALLAQGYRYIAGVDEVGRGPLAGPVVCAAVIMPQIGRASCRERVCLSV